MRFGILVLAVLLTVPLASAELVSFRRSYGGSGDDATFDIFVDPNGIYTVGSTGSFGSNPPNAFLTIFNSDNSHRCSVALDVGAADQAVALTVHAGRIYVLGTTNFGANPPNHFVAVFDTSCNLQTFKLFDIGLDDVRDIAVEPAASPSFYIVGSQTTNGVYLAKLDSSLNVVWARGFKVRGGNDVANSVFFSGGRVYVAGTSDDGSSLNMFLSVFDTAGVHVATRELAGSTNEEAYGVLFSGGNIYLTGYVDYPGRANEMVLAKLDTSYNLQWVKAFGTTTGNEVSRGLTIAGGLVYIIGFTNTLGTLDAVLTAFAPDGSFSHSFFISGGGMGNDVGHSVAGLGSCVYPAGQHFNWPLFYAVFDGQVNTVVFTINPISPSITNITPLTPSASPSISSYTPLIDSPASSNSFYSRFCPDMLVSATTTTVTTTVGTTTTTTSTVTSTTTAYAIATTTLTQTSSVILVISQTTYSTIPVTTTQTIPTTTTTTTTSTASTTTTSTLTNTVTTTQSTTQTLTAITTVTFAEPVSTYILPMVLLMIAVVGATAVIVGRRRGPSPADEQRYSTRF